jgi:hypothetical protein
MAQPPPLPPTDGPIPPPESPPEAAPGAPPGPDLRQQATAAGQAALQALKLYLANPIGDMGRAFDALGAKRAFGAGLVFAGTAIVAMIVGLLLMPRGFNTGFTGFLKSLLQVVVVGVVSFGILVGAILGARSALGGKGTIEGDVFIAGASQLPISLWILVSGVVGPANYEVILITGVFAFCYATFILYGGCTKISGISEKAATLAVPAILVVTVWLGSVINRAVM